MFRFGSNPTVKKKITLALPSFQAVWMTLIFQWRVWGGRGPEWRCTQGEHILRNISAETFPPAWVSALLRAAIMAAQEPREEDAPRVEWEGFAVAEFVAPY